MIHTAEQLADSVRSLPLAEREEFFRLLGSPARNGEAANSQDESDEKFQKALKWVDENRKEYDGQFVLLEGDNLLACGTDPKRLYDEARKRGIRAPFVKRVKAEVLPFGGW